MIKILDTVSPNFNSRPKESKIDMLVIHHTAMNNAESAVNWLCSPESRVSCHYLIAEDGRIFNLVEEDKKAWHAGSSYWRGKSNINDNSIGIELDNPGLEPFTTPQMESLLHLSHRILLRYPIKPYNIVAHSDIAPNRKVDPNRHFNWKQFSQSGIGMFSEVSTRHNRILYRFGDNSRGVYNIKAKLAELGYYLDLSNQYDKQLNNAVHAFKRRFVPESYENTFWDELSEARLTDLLIQIKNL